MADMLIRIKTKLKLSAGFILCASLCSAAGSIATVTSGEPFSVDGVTLSNAGVSSWPLISNDTIATSKAGALVKFRDGSAVKLAPQSRIKLAGSDSAPTVVVMAGNVDFKVAPGSRLLVTRSASDSDKDPGTVTEANTGARANNNNTFRKLAFMYGASAVSLGGLGLAVDAVLQPQAVSTR